MHGIRDEFPQLLGPRYLNHAAIAPWPQRSVDAVRRFAEESVRRGAVHYTGWPLITKRLRRLPNAPTSAEVALVKSTAEALSFVAVSLDWRPGR